MAGKHSKSFFDSLLAIDLKPRIREKAVKAPLKLPFKISILILVLSLILSSAYIAVFFVSGKMNEKILNNAADIFAANQSETALKILSTQNNNIKGWLKIDGTNVNNAVCQADDDIYYINHNQKNKKSRYGALFLASDDTFERDGDRNIVIFGNNMKDGTMFGTLKKYRNLNFYKQNPIVKLYYGTKSESYAIFAVMLISSAKDDANSGFYPSKSFFNSKEEFDNWSAEVRNRSLITVDIDVDYGDDILTLVTLANDFDGARLTVMAKKLDSNETADIDTSSAVVNSKIKYPKIWYSTRGLEYPY